MLIEKIIHAAEKSGFNLEFKTKKILDGLNYDCQLNSLVRSEREIIEIDLIAINTMTQHHVIIECKGSSPESSLILIQEQTNQNNSINRIDLDEHIRINQFSNLQQNFIAFTGDFFDEKYNRKSKDDTKNNVTPQLPLTIA